MTNVEAVQPKMDDWQVLLGDEDDVAAKRDEFDRYIGRISEYVELGPGSRILEVGIGTGWFSLNAAERGFRCDAIEPSGPLVRHARQLAESRGVELGLIEAGVGDAELPERAYDVIFASSVFEHVHDWRAGLENLYPALRPGGVLYFYSTNRFALRSGERKRVPLYGWLPDPLRHGLRVALDGPEIVLTSGIDFNQFTYRRLRREFTRMGFTRVLDAIELQRADGAPATSRSRRAVLYLARRSRLVGALARVFAPGTLFICVK